MEFCHKIRDEIKFPSFEALKAQIEQDVKTAKAFLQNRIILKWIKLENNATVDYKNTLNLPETGFPYAWRDVAKREPVMLKIGMTNRCIKNSPSD